MALVLSRFEGESVMIGDDIRVFIGGVDRQTGKVKLAIEAPPDVPVHRREVWQAIREQTKKGT